jgi:hypothetical protein
MKRMNGDTKRQCDRALCEDRDCHGHLAAVDQIREHGRCAHITVRREVGLA